MTKTIKGSNMTVKAPKIPKVSPELVNLEATLNKKFGENAIRLGFPKDESGKVKPIQRIPTGSFSLDVALGGGIPEGRLTEISGDYSIGKSTIALKILVNAQKAGYVCAFLDSEGTSDKDYLKYLGVDISTLLYSRPDGLEEAAQMLIEMQRSKFVHFALWDSIAASPPMKEYEKDFDDPLQLGIKPKLLGEYCRKYQASNNRLVREGNKPFTLIMVNQLRDKIGVVYGETDFSPGGRAKNFTKSVDIRLRRGDWIVEGTGEKKHIVGQVVKFKIDKNKTYKRMQEGSFDFYTDSENESDIRALDIDNFKEIFAASISYGVIDRSGGWYKIEEHDIKYQGMDKMIDHLKNHPEIAEKCKEKVLNLLAKGG